MHEMNECMNILNKGMNAVKDCMNWMNEQLNQKMIKVMNESYEWMRT